MKKQSQNDFVKNELLKEGKISRNYCLDLHRLGVRTNILRLGAIIHGLKEQGWQIEGADEQTDTGADFVYRLQGSPYRKVVYTTQEGNQIIRYEKA